MTEQIPALAIALKQMATKASAYRQARDYVEGRHRLAFATDKFRTAFGSLFQAFADNLCTSVIDAVADRLIITGFAVESGPGQLADDLWSIWMANRMDQRAGEVHSEALVAGDAYVIVWPDRDGNVTIYPQEAGNVIVHYDSESPGQLQWAAKCWALEDKRLRANLYYPDRIEKYIGKSTVGWPENSNGFQPYEIEGEAWPLPNPYGQVPVFHFANSGRIGGFGRSELADVIPLQDALNKAIADMLVAMEYVALPQRWATGLEVDIDEATGKPKAPFVPGVDRIWAVGAADVKFGEFIPADLAQFLAVQEKFRQEIAAVSRTPLHFIIPPAGQWPSGESLKSAESAFLKKVRDRQVAFGNVWESVMRLALRMAGRPDAALSCMWEDPTPRNELDHANVAVLKSQVGIPERQLWREWGYSEAEIEQMLEEREAGSKQLGEQLLTAFERGE